MQELLLCELHVQEVLEHQPVPEHGALPGKTEKKKSAKESTALIQARLRAEGQPTCCAFPSVRRAVARGGRRNGRPAWRPYFPETQTNDRSADQSSSLRVRRASQHTHTSETQTHTELRFSHDSFSASGPILMQEIQTNMSPENIEIRSFFFSP